MADDEIYSTTTLFEKPVKRIDAQSSMSSFSGLFVSFFSILPMIFARTNAFFFFSFVVIFALLITDGFFIFCASFALFFCPVLFIVVAIFLCIVWIPWF